MRTYSVLFILTTVIVVVLMVVNGGNLFRNSEVIVPFVGAMKGPIRLIGLLALIGVAGAYSLAWSLSSTRSQAKSAGYLRQIEDLRKSLDKEEASRFANLRAELDRQFGAIQAKLETGPVSASLASSGGGASTERLVQAMNARVDRVRDELAADIGASEDAILKAIEGKIALGDIKMIEADRPKRLP